MAHFTPASLEFLRCHHGVAASADLQRCGLSAPAIRSLAEAGNLVIAFKGVYRLPAITFDELSKCAAICAAHPEVAIGGPTAGRLWGLRRLPRDRRIHLLAPPASHPTITRWVVPYRTAAFHPEDIVVRPDGIAITSRARTALDLSRYVGSADLLSIIEQVMHDDPVSDAELRAVAVDWMSPQRPWARRFLELIDGRMRGGPAESHGEVVLGEALRAAGLRIERQYRIDLPGYGPARFDLAIPSAMIAVEIDLHPTHAETAGRARDAARDAAAAGLGWVVVRVLAGDMGLDLDATVARLARLVADRTRRR